MAVIWEDEDVLGLESSFAQVQEVLVWVAGCGGRDMKGSQCPGVSHGLSEERDHEDHLRHRGALEGPGPSLQAEGGLVGKTGKASVAAPWGGEQDSG